MSVEQKEISRLRAELARVKMERRILAANSSMTTAVSLAARRNRDACGDKSVLTLELV